MKKKNKWVEKKIEEISGLLEELCDEYDKSLNFEYQVDNFLTKLQDSFTQTQQETLEWCLENVVGEDEPAPEGTLFKQTIRNRFKDKQRQTIKNKMEEK